MWRKKVSIDKVQKVLPLIIISNCFLEIKEFLVNFNLQNVEIMF